MECAFGLKTDNGTYYAVNVGQSAEGMQKFQSGARVTVEGSFIPKEALSTDQWDRYTMKGIFTITRVQPSVAEQGKINIVEVCRGALTYTDFVDAASAKAFVADCIAGKHPEVIENYIRQMGVDDGAAI